ncbi:MAG: hypothetical protein ABRQ34_10795 [Smithellaceae bacterium]
MPCLSAVKITGAEKIVAFPPQKLSVLDEKVENVAQISRNYNNLLSHRIILKNGMYIA